MKQRFVAPSMDDAIDEITSDKDIDINTIREAIENAVSEAYQQQYKTGLPVKTELKPNGELIIKAAKTVVEEVSEERTEIAQSDPLAAGYGLGDEVFILVSNPNIDKKKRVTDEFGRVAALTAKQVIRQKLREAERRRVYEEYKGKEGEMVHGTVQRIRHGTIIVDLGRTEAILPRRELIPRERFVENDRIKAVIYEVRMDNRGVQVVLSRRHTWLVQRLFEMEITEVYDGTVEIKSIAREAGFRTKVAVLSHDSAVDPVGACVGQKGIRVQTVVRELGGEKVDIAYWHEEPVAFIKEALKPAEVERVNLNESINTAEVIVPEDQLSLAIGKDGQNARLAAKLTEWTINICSRADLAREQARELIAVTFGSSPEEVFASIGVGPETAPILLENGLVELEKLANPDDARLLELVGESAAVIITERAEAVWTDMQKKAAKMMAEELETEKEAKAAAEAKAKEVLPFELPSGLAVATVEELTGALDELPGDEVEALLIRDDLKLWLQDMGLPPEEMANLMSRYK